MAVYAYLPRPADLALALSTACTDGELATCVGHTSVLTTKHAN